RYYLQGVCREGSKCLFSHDLATSKSSTICKYYQKGQCAYGARCRCSWKGHGEAGSSCCSSSLPPARPSAHFWGLLVSPGLLGRLSSSTAFPGVSRLKLPEECSRECWALIHQGYLCGSSEEKQRPSPGAVLCCSEPGDSEEAKPPSYLEAKPPLYVEAKPHSYLEAICSGLQEPGGCPGGSEQQLCPYAAVGACHFGERCLYLHGELCEICGLQVLHPFDQEQRKAHEMMCMATFEHDMERAFAIQASQDKVCSICMEVVYEKPSASERRFGILSNCTHTYCLSCIRQWRCAKQFENPIIKSCPECRVISEFVIPSAYWVEEQEKKNELIEAFKQGVGKKPCKYFEQGKGTCPFGGKCLYLHAYPDGTRAEPEKPRKQLSSEGTVRFFNSVRLWDFIEDRESRSAPGADSEVTELGELFMHLSGAEEDPTAAQ
ncbi:MKRN2 ligase, partial [Hylia prasina]|nr:MKRN2 ligase [Hylia prasina]